MVRSFYQFPFRIVLFLGHFTQNALFVPTTILGPFQIKPTGSEPFSPPPPFSAQTTTLWFVDALFDGWEHLEPQPLLLSETFGFPL